MSVQGVETAAQVPTTEVKPEATQAAAPPPTTPEVKETERPQFAAIVKKEKQIVRERQAIKAERERLELERMAFQKDIEAMKRFKELSNPMDALKEKGWSYEDLTNFVLQEGKVPPEKLVGDIKKELEEFKTKQQQEREKQAQEAKERAELEMQQVVENFKNETNQLIQTNKDTYELINLHDASEVVFATVEEHFNKTNKILSIKEACDLVEKYLEDETTKALSTKKLSAKFKSLEADKTKEEPGAVPAKGSPKTPDYTSFTLNNTMTPGAGAGPVAAKTLEDRMRRAMAVLDKRQA